MRDIREIAARMNTWKEAIENSLMEKEVNVFESRNSSDEPIKLQFEDILDDEGQFMMDQWAKNVKIQVWIRKQFE
jgi:hypothetical protein